MLFLKLKFHFSTSAQRCDEKDTEKRNVKRNVKQETSRLRSKGMGVSLKALSLSLGMSLILSLDLSTAQSKTSGDEKADKAGTTPKATTEDAQWTGDDVKWAGSFSMNGYRLDTYGNFLENWYLVTVRYRADSGEFRFVYANPIAWKTLQAKPNLFPSEYPEGSVFAKAAFLLSHDSRFPSSLTPSEVGRYQLMVKNTKKHASTNGWGYALFNAKGQTFPGNPETVSRACNSCHQIVQDRGGIFSSPLQNAVTFFSEKNPKLSLKSKSSNPSLPHLPTFETVEIKSLPSELVSVLPPTAGSARSILGDLRKNLFQGTLDEIRPFLALEALRTQMPALLLSSDGKRFAAVFRDPAKSSHCETPGQKSESMIFLLTVPQTKPYDLATPYGPLPKADSRVVTQSVCFSKE